MSSNKYTEPTPKERRRALSQLNALRRKERYVAGLGNPAILPLSLPVVGDKDTGELKEKPRCSFHEDHADPCVSPCPFGMVWGSCPLKSPPPGKRHGGVT